MKKTKNAMLKKYLKMMHKKLMNCTSKPDKLKKKNRPEKNYKMIGI